MVSIAGGEALMRALHHEGVEYVFGLPGSTELLFLDALEDHPEMKYILGLHEVVALGMAEGYTRISGKVGVVNLHTCAGLAAALPALHSLSGWGRPALVRAVAAGAFLICALATHRLMYRRRPKKIPIQVKEMVMGE